MNILIILNPGAGTPEKKDAEELIRRYLLENEHSANWFTTSGNDDLDALRKFIKQITLPDLILASGGDGTCNLAAHIAIEFNVPMGIIPAGSANALAKELDIPLTIIEALELIEKGKVRKIDYLKVNDILCIRQAGIGINAQLIDSFESSGSRGMFSYVRHFVTMLFRWKSFSVRILRGTSFLKKRHVISVTIATSTKYGTGAIINPTGSIDDGKFEVVLIRSFPWYSLPSLTIRFYTGKIHESIYTDTLSTEKATLSWKKEKLLQIDGELMGKVRTVTVVAHQKGLQVLVP